MRKFFLLFIALGSSITLLAQTDSVKAENIANTVQLKSKQLLLDSLNKEDLLNQLKTADVLKRKELEDKLNTLTEQNTKRQEQLQSELAKLKLSSIGYPVTLFKDTVIYVYTKIGPFKAQERAKTITEKLKNIYELNSFQKDSFKVAQSESTTDIMYDDIIVMSINDIEALWHGLSALELANNYKNTFANKLQEVREETSFLNYTIRVAEVLAVLLVLWLLLRLLNKLSARIKLYVISKKEVFIKSIVIRNYELIGADSVQGTLLTAINPIKIFLYVVIIYLSLPILFSIFPYTQDWANLLINWILTPIKKMLNGVIGYLPNLFSILVIYFTIKYLVRFLSYLSSEIQLGKLKINGLEPELVVPTMNIIKFLLYAFMFVLIFPYLPGSDSPIFQGVSVFLGILFSMGSSSTVGNIIAGLVITYMKPFSLGDRIKVGEVVGDVMGKSLLVTRIRTIKNEDITIPNSNLLSGHVVNYSSSSKTIGLVMHTTVTIGYDVPWKDMHAALIEAALSTPLILAEPKPFVLQTSLDDFYVSYQINAYTQEANKQAVIYSNLHTNIQDKCNERGIEILSPHYRAARDGNQTTIPANYLPTDYEAPSFRVENTTKNK